MAKRELPSPALLRQLLRYDPETGYLFWKARSPSYFNPVRYSADRAAAVWNAQWAGKRAFTSLGNHGYFEGAVFSKNYLAHRVIWALVHGEWPEGDIDHISGNKTDNRLCNLRDVSVSINCRNATGKCNNTSGATGISWRADREKWRARIMIDYKEVCLGHFDRFEDAVAAREAASAKNRFTERHGKFNEQPLL